MQQLCICIYIQVRTNPKARYSASDTKGIQEALAADCIICNLEVELPPHIHVLSKDRLSYISKISEESMKT